MVEEVTRGQSKSKLWFQQRTGRVTASRLKSALSTSLAKPSQSIIKLICYPESSKFYSAGCTWGCNHEGPAREAYVAQYKSKHERFMISRSGLVLNSKYPFMGASPDGIVSCQCCGRGVLEIKCPYSCRNKTLSEFEGEVSFLEKSQEGKMEIKRTHSYYYQLQMQMKFCNTIYGDFIVYTNQDLFVQRIAIDDKFITEALQKVQPFIKIGILPEVLGKVLTKEPTCIEHGNSQFETKDDVWCYCKRGEEGNMIACDNSSCPIQWFHLQCLKLSLEDVPKGSWYCKECTAFINKKKRHKSGH